MRVEAEQHRGRAAPFGLLQCAPDEGSPPAGGDADNNIPRAYRTKLNRTASSPRIVLRSLDRFPKSALPARNDPLHHFRRSTESRRAFARIQDTQAPTAACAHIEETASFLERAHDCEDGLLNPFLLF